MSFLGWTLLIGGSGASKSKKPSNNPQQRLAKFKRTHNQALKIWHEIPSSTLDATSLDVIQSNLHRLTTILEDDTRAPAPHLCLSYAASSFVYTSISRIALASDNEDVVREAVSIFTILVDNDEENLLGTERFAETVMSFVDAVLGYNTYVATSETQGELLELMFGIASKIRLEPELLPVWFRRSTTLIPSEKGSEAGDDDADEKIDFPLCHQFVGHVYHEGRVGDFARYGLLYMFESASNSTVLESWIVNSDLPTLLASGLGALYSQLSRKLQIAYPSQDLPLVLALSASDRDDTTLDVESFYSEDLQGRLRIFMQYMIFWQDILNQCYSSDIKQTLIDHFQVFFLQQILYPSLLESSDADGGSSVAVLTYLWNILDSIEHPDIISMILGYLLALSEPLQSESAAPRSPVAEKRREDLLSISQTHDNEEAMTPAFFNLTDMILASCQSRNSETVTAALRLVNVILTKYHSYALSSLLRTTPALLARSSRTSSALNQELSFLIVLANGIAGSEGMDEAYEASLKDSLALIESHVCSRDLFAMGNQSNEARQKDRRKSILDSESQEARPHVLEPDDPLLMLLLDLLATFFTNTIEVNLGLTSVITHLASCPWTRLEGFLVREPSASNSSDTAEHALLEEEDNESAAVGNFLEEQERLEQERVDAFKAKRSTHTAVQGEAPALIRILQWLGDVLRDTKAAIPEFESLISSRKRAFLGAMEIENELAEQATSLLSPRLSNDDSRDTSRSRAAPVPSRSPKRTSLDTPRGTSPRGRTLTAIAGQVRSPGASPKSDTSKRPKPIASPKFHPSELSRDSSPTKLARTLSPLKMTHGVNDGDGTPSSPLPSANDPLVRDEIIERKIRFPVRPRVTTGIGRSSEMNEGNEASPADGNQHADTGSSKEPEEKEASLTHVLTNVVILQEFVLEIAAIIQVRAGLLDGEIDFV